jgi:hypothetical protein
LRSSVHRVLRSVSARDLVEKAGLQRIDLDLIRLVNVARVGLVLEQAGIVLVKTTTRGCLARLVQPCPPTACRSRPRREGFPEGRGR